MKQYLVAHRGLSGIAPENTMLAFDVAAAYACDGIEMDVHLTADKQLVICHDETIDRTSDMQGTIAHMTLSELRQANFAAKHELKWIPKQTIMTLDEVFARYRDKFRFLNIEIKTDITRYPGIEELVTSCIQHHKMEDRLMITCFNFESLRIMHKLLPRLALGFLWETDAQWKKIDKQELKQTCKYLNPKFELYKANVTEYEALGLKFNFWTVRDRQTHTEMAQVSSAYSQISNFPF